MLADEVRTRPPDVQTIRNLRRVDSTPAPTLTPTIASRVVVAHDFMETYGGAERITAEIAKGFPEAQVVAIMGQEWVAERMGVADRFTSLLRPTPSLLRHYRLLTPVLPLIVDRLRVPDADVIVSSSYAFAHRLRSRNRAPRVCYTYSPLRFAWAMNDAYRDQWARGRLGRLAFDALAKAMRRSDRRSAQGVTRYLAPDAFVANQLERFYGRDSTVVGAPVDCSTFKPGGVGVGDFWLFCGRLIEPYKKITITIEAFNRLGTPLVVAGDGPERARLEAIAGPNIEFTGMLSDDALIPLMQRCQATIFPSQDDFGLIPLEVNACGRPVLAYAGGGALETVAPGLSGQFFNVQSTDAIVVAVERFDPAHYNPAAIREHALAWDAPRFRERLVAAASEVMTAG